MATEWVGDGGIIPVLVPVPAHDGGPSPSLNLITRSKFKSKIQEWVNVLLAQPSELSVWVYGISPGFVTSLEQGPDLELS